MMGRGPSGRRFTVAERDAAFDAVYALLRRVMARAERQAAEAEPTDASTAAPAEPARSGKSKATRRFDR